MLYDFIPHNEKQIMKTAILACAVFLCAGILFGSLQEEFIGDLELVYHGDGTMIVQDDGIIAGTSYVSVAIISIGERDRLKIRNVAGSPGLTRPYNISIESLSNRLSAVKISLGGGPTSTVNIVANDLKTLITHQCILNAKAISDKKLGSIFADPGVFTLYAPTATIRKIVGQSFVGDLKYTETRPGSVLPQFRIVGDRINRIRVRKYRKYLNHWISQVYCRRLGKLKATSISHISAIERINRIQSFNMTGFIQSGVLISNNVVRGYTNGVIKQIRTGVVYDCYILAGVPFLTNSVTTNLYYDTVEAMGKVRKVRMVSTVETKLVSGRKINIGKRDRKTQYGNGTEIWEKQKQKKIKIKHLP
jgi:hypothetical protein